MTEQEIRKYLRRIEEENSQTALRSFYNLCFDRFFRIAYYYLHTEQRRKDMTADAFDGVSISGESPEDILVSEELFAHYVKALDRLPERCREIFIRVREEKQSYAEVAKDLGISVNTVDVQLQKAIGRMWDMLSRYISGTEN